MDDDQLPELVLPMEERDHCFGTPRARRTLVEYGDYECPHCAHVFPIVKELQRELGDELCFAFRNYPLTRLHPHAEAAAEAAEAAGLQGKFWLMHDRLFEHPSTLSAPDLHRHAVEISLDLHTYEKDLTTGAAALRVAEDVESGNEAGVGATPTFFVNGRMHAGSYEFLPLLAALRAGTV